MRGWVLFLSGVFRVPSELYFHCGSKNLDLDGLTHYGKFYFQTELHNDNKNYLKVMLTNLNLENAVG